MFLIMNLFDKRKYNQHVHFNIYDLFYSQYSPRNMFRPVSRPVSRTDDTRNLHSGLKLTILLP